MSTLHVDTLIRLGEQFAHAVATLAAHRKDFDRADQLVDHLSLCGVPAVAVPPSWPLTAYAPLIVVNSIEHAVPAIEATGHIVINNQGKYLINPPEGVAIDAFTFRLEQRT
ncbi:hypothetical protein C8E02_1171 [Vogesella indigofera]|uniref:Uncharacterized protein n=1 Tax=Vogesella indigofera TaxID=45465 RepID=A0A495BJ75_VOGIN|nr:hypothetical protein [Vogesella indigofera]RKQ61397.1 hypothetical protein C8E02_1171 [Vogesella indigofera]